MLQFVLFAKKTTARQLVKTDSLPRENKGLGVNMLLLLPMLETEYMNISTQPETVLFRAESKLSQ